MYSVNTVNTTTRHFKPVWPTFFYTKEDILKNVTKQFWWPLTYIVWMKKTFLKILSLCSREESKSNRFGMNEWMNEAVRVLSLLSSLFMVLWQSPDSPVMSCFYIFLCALVCMPCFMLERGVRIQALMSCWVSVSCRGSDTRGPCSVLLCKRAVSSSLGPCALLSACVVVFCAACGSCSAACFLVVLCCRTRLGVPSAVCFHALCEHVAYEGSHWLCVCVLFCTWLVICFASHVLVILFRVSTWLLSLFSVCHVLSCQLSWHRPSCYLIIGSFAPPVFPPYPPCLVPIYSPCVCSPVPVCLSYQPWLCSALPCPVQPCCLLVFHPQGSFYFCFILLINVHLLHNPHLIPLPKPWQRHLY